MDYALGVGGQAVKSSPKSMLNKAGNPHRLPTHTRSVLHFHNAIIEESGSKVRLFSGFIIIKVANHAIVALWPMKDSSFPQQMALQTWKRSIEF